MGLQNREEIKADSQASHTHAEGMATTTALIPWALPACRQSKNEAQATSQDRTNFSEKRQQVDTAGVPFSLKGLPKTS